MSLIVTGSIGIDTVITPTGRADEVLGGSSIYFAAAASFFCPVRVVGAVGEDCPDSFLDAFRHFKVDTAGIEKRRGSKTFRWTGKYLDNMNDRETLSVELNVLAEALPPVPDAYRDSQYVFLANTDPGSQMALLDQFPHARLVVADTMDLWIKTQHEPLMKLLGRLDGLVLNDSESELLTGKTNLVAAAQAIRKMGPKFVVIKKGEHGALLEHADGRAMLPAWPTADVIDPTGAGDSFAGGMMGRLAAEGDLSFDAVRRALAAGTVVASYNIESFSLDRLRQITRADIDARLAAYAKMLAL